MFCGTNHPDKEKLNEEPSKAFEKKVGGSFLQVSFSAWPKVYGRLFFFSVLTFSQALYTTLLTGFVREGCYHMYLEERAL